MLNYSKAKMKIYSQLMNKKLLFFALLVLILCITALMGQGFRSIAGQPFRESTGHFPFTIISDFF